MNRLINTAMGNLRCPLCGEEGKYVMGMVRLANGDVGGHLTCLACDEKWLVDAEGNEIK